MTNKIKKELINEMYEDGQDTAIAMYEALEDTHIIDPEEKYEYEFDVVQRLLDFKDNINVCYFRNKEEIEDTKGLKKGGANLLNECVDSYVEGFNKKMGEYINNI